MEGNCEEKLKENLTGVVVGSGFLLFLACLRSTCGVWGEGLTWLRRALRALIFQCIQANRECM